MSHIPFDIHQYRKKLERELNDITVRGEVSIYKNTGKVTTRLTNGKRTIEYLHYFINIPVLALTDVEGSLAELVADKWNKGEK